MSGDRGCKVRAAGGHGVSRPLLRALCALALSASWVGAAFARPPGTLTSAAAGDGHLWWAVRRIAPEVPGATRPGAEPEYLLMHHASVEPAPTERFVMRLRTAPDAIAAEEASVALVLPPEGDRKRLVLLIGTRRNDAVGHWYTDPRGAPRILAPLDGRGAILDSAMAGGTVFIARAGHDESDAERVELLSLSTAAGAEWKSEPLPPLDGRASAASGGWTLFRDGATLCAIGSASGAPSIARLVRGTWTVESMPSADAGPSLGAFTLDGRVVTVARDAAAGAAAPGAVPTVRLSVLRTGSRSAWAQFAEPARPWIATAFGSDAVVLELDEAGRGSVRAISPSSNAPGEPVTLLPPGFASGSWVHLPLLAAVSVAFALAAMIFGSDAYLQSRLGKRDRAARPLGAALSRRLLAFAIDAAPAFVVCWFVVGGSPAPLLDHPLLSANIVAALPATLVLAGGWLLAALGDAVGGRSLGKRALGLVVIGRDGGRARLGPRLARALLGAVGVFSPPVMLLALANPWGDGPAEMLSGTAVVDEVEWRALAARTPSEPGRA